MFAELSEHEWRATVRCVHRSKFANVPDPSRDKVTTYSHRDILNIFLASSGVSVKLPSSIFLNEASNRGTRGYKRPSVLTPDVNMTPRVYEVGATAQSGERDYHRTISRVSPEHAGFAIEPPRRKFGAIVSTGSFERSGFPSLPGSTVVERDESGPPSDSLFLTVFDRSR